VTVSQLVEPKRVVSSIEISNETKKNLPKAQDTSNDVFWGLLSTSVSSMSSPSCGGDKGDVWRRRQCRVRYESCSTCRHNVTDTFKKMKKMKMYCKFFF
jgi:hypothetical protein